MGWYPQSLHSAIIASAAGPLFVHTLSLWMARSLTLVFYIKPLGHGYSISGASLAHWPLASLLFFTATPTRASLKGPCGPSGSGCGCWPASPPSALLSVFLSITASWYLAAVACLLLLFVIRQEKAMYSLIGPCRKPLYLELSLGISGTQPHCAQIRQAHAISLRLAISILVEHSTRLIRTECLHQSLALSGPPAPTLAEPVPTDSHVACCAAHPLGFAGSLRHSLSLSMAAWHDCPRRDAARKAFQIRYPHFWSSVLLPSLFWPLHFPASTVYTS